MFQGFYSLTSSLINQNRNLNVISNNMVNVSTPGYKSDRFVTSTFREEMLYRSGNKDKSDSVPIGTSVMANMASECVTSYENGGLEPTNVKLDFAIVGNGFFQIETVNGPVYTRNGSFIIDDEGYLALPSVGRVTGTGGLLRLNTDQIAVDEQGRITSQDGNTYLGQIGVFDFNDYNQLVKSDNGVFTGAGVRAATGATVRQGFLEGSNVSMEEEMTSMMSAQRSLQSAAQVLKMYDQLTAKIVQIGSMN